MEQPRSCQKIQEVRAYNGCGNIPRRPAHVDDNLHAVCQAWMRHAEGLAKNTLHAVPLNGSPEMFGNGNAQSCRSVRVLPPPIE